jgi:hypothetical protein
MTTDDLQTGAKPILQTQWIIKYILVDSEHNVDITSHNAFIIIKQVIIIRIQNNSTQELAEPVNSTNLSVRHFEARGYDY